MLIDLARARREVSLGNWVEESRAEFQKPNRYPGISFDVDFWPVRSAYNTKIVNINLETTFGLLAGKRSSYRDAIRCDISEIAVADQRRDIQTRLRAWRTFIRDGPDCLLEMNAHHLRAIEAEVLRQVAASPSSAGSRLASLQELSRVLVRLMAVGVVEAFSWTISAETLRSLITTSAQQRKEFRKRKGAILDRQIESLSDAMRAMFEGDSRLDQFDRGSLAVVGLLMCVPSRVNEPLCMSVDDTFTLDDYSKRSDGQLGSSETQRAHMLLLQKGSKGAAWGAKPALSFMINLLKACMEVLVKGGRRSRMLAAWYEENPGKLYLPAGLESLRGQRIDRIRLWQIVNLSDVAPTTRRSSSVKPIMDELADAGAIISIPNPKQFRVGGSTNSRHTVEAVNWDDLERVLLRRVHAALADARRVTPHNVYEGRTSKMLVLFDTVETPYLPGSIKYGALTARLKPRADRMEGTQLTVFEKLDLNLVNDGRVQSAWLELHDPRRWLSTQALRAKERLSDVLINKWANRISLNQLQSYDLRSDTEKADHAAMPKVLELEDFSAALQDLEGLEAKYGLESTLVSTRDVAVTMTSMDAITNAIGDRPVARTGNEIIVVYRSKFGACLHQHHETPCRAYSCGPCNNNLVVKGHRPTNESVRKRDADLRRSIVMQIDKLATAHNRGVADMPERLEDHMLTIVREGLNAEEMADELISQFHEIKDRIKSVALKNKLEEAFVMRGFVQRLDSLEVRSGALMRYHNPGRHSSPGHERALDAYGGRSAIAVQLAQFHLDHPQFAPTSLGLKDERDLIQDIEDDDEDSSSE